MNLLPGMFKAYACTLKFDTILNKLVELIHTGVSCMRDINFGETTFKNMITMSAGWIINIIVESLGRVHSLDK